MRHLILGSLLAVSALAPAAASAQTTTAIPVQTITGTRLDVVATGEVARVPDIARISTGVVTTAPTATAALQENARRMAAVREGLKRAGVADRDIQTSSMNLYPDYRHDERGGVPQLIGYRAHNELSVRFRDIANAGRIIDALVAQGANQVNGPMLGIDKPEAALDEARTRALAAARARAELYARALGKRVGRILAVSETGGQYGPPIVAMRARGEAMAVSGTQIEPGEQVLAVSLSVTFELE
jgi:uncharacterized protein